jgi:peptidoglycan-associated lipoprotein
MTLANDQRRYAASVAALAALAFTAACASHPKPPPAPPIPPPHAAQQPSAPYAAAPPEGAVNSAPLPGTERDFVINIGDRVYFDFDQASIRADAEPVLSNQAAWLQRYPDVRVRIEGNCDERGTREYNFALGARRADAVRQFLVNHGVSGGRIATISYGKEQPLDPGHDETAWAKDRNAHTAIVGGARPG